MQFFPKESLNGGEAFIWTDVEYNAVTNVLAVPGCYWASPYDIQLFTFKDPVSEHQRFIDLIECFDGGFDAYEDVEFDKWEHTDLCITRLNAETMSKEAVRVREEVYMSWLNEKGREL